MSKLSLLKYGHEFCGPCKMIKPILQNISAKYTDRVEVVDKDTYSMDPGELSRANIKAVPTLILVKDGVEIWRNVGFLNEDQIVEVISNYL